jgi:tRNA/rRNA methyltransferase
MTGTLGRRPAADQDGAVRDGSLCVNAISVSIEPPDAEGVRYAVPRASATGEAVADIVRTCHESPTPQLNGSDTALDAAAIDAILTYCAEKRCADDDASCPGCRRRCNVDAIASIDAFVARHARITFDDGAATITGPGLRTLKAPSLEWLARHWHGEEYWYWARRVIRKRRHGVRTREDHRAVSAADTSPSVILVEPQLADNIGMVARAMANFGLDDLRLVAPRDGWPNEKARIAASGATFIIDDVRAEPTLQAATGDLTWVCATTARQRDLAKPVLTPAEAVVEMRSRISRGERVGVIFGRERNGLETTEIAMADAIVMAPVMPQFASLNLAQAVLLLAYEWLKSGGEGTLGRVTTYESPRSTGLHHRGYAPATKDELMGLFEHLERELERSGFLNPPEKRPTMVQNLRTMLTRMEPTEQEVRTLRGIIKALVHGKGPGRRPD